MIEEATAEAGTILRWAIAALFMAAATALTLLLLASPAHAQAAPDGAGAAAIADAQGGDGGSARGGEGGVGGSGVLANCSSNSNDVADVADVADVVCPAGAAGGAGGTGGVSEGGEGGIAFTVGLPAPPTSTPAGPDLAITKSGPAGPINGCAFLALPPGGCTVQYTVTVGNVGNQTMNGITVNDTPTVTPKLVGQGFFSKVSASPSQGTCNAPGNVGGNPTTVPFSCNLGSLAPGAVATIQVTTRTLVALVSPTAVQTNVATVSSTTPDNNAANNTSPTVTTNLVAA